MIALTKELARLGMVAMVHLNMDSINEAPTHLEGQNIVAFAELLGSERLLFGTDMHFEPRRSGATRLGCRTSSNPTG